MNKKSNSTTFKARSFATSARTSFRRSYIKINASRYAGIRNGVLNRNGK